MKISILCDSYKESLSGIEVGNIIKTSFAQEFSDASFFVSAIADGGEGTLDILVNCKKGYIKTYDVCDPLNRMVSARVGYFDDVAVIESAEACGLHHLNNNERNPLYATSYGVGELLIKAVEEGSNKLLICLGGTATNDLGLGILSALGYKFFDKNNNEVNPVVKNFMDIVKIDDANIYDLSHIDIEVAVDVKNCLLGENGASYIFGPQKGAIDVEYLDKCLSHVNDIFISQYNINLNNYVGGGAAGGIASMLAGVFNAKLVPGFEIVNKHLKLEEQIKDSDLVITGEGKMDLQSINGKGPIQVAMLAKKYNVPVIAICGSISDDIKEVYNYGVTGAYSIINSPMDLEVALKETEKNISITATSIAKTLKIMNKR